MITSRYTTPKKVGARADTLIGYYADVFGRPCLPVRQQYWSMCATCAQDGQVLPHSELDQVLRAGLIEPHQFHGVDRDEAVYAANRTYAKAQWYCGDFYAVLSEAADAPEFRPGIVNVDTTSEPQRGVDLFCRVLERLQGYEDVLFVGNFILRNRNREYAVEDVVTRLSRNPRFRLVGNTLQWDPARLCYVYHGATYANCTRMCSVVLWRKNVLTTAAGTR